MDTPRNSNLGSIEPVSDEAKHRKSKIVGFNNFFKLQKIEHNSKCQYTAFYSHFTRRTLTFQPCELGSSPNKVDFSRRWCL